MTAPFPYNEVHDQMIEALTFKERLLTLDPSDITRFIVVSVLIAAMIVVLFTFSARLFAFNSKTLMTLLIASLTLSAPFFVGFSLDESRHKGDKLAEEALREWVKETYGLAFTSEQLSELDPAAVMAGKDVAATQVDGVYHALKLVPGGLILQQATLKGIEPFTPPAHKEAAK